MAEIKFQKGSEEWLMFQSYYQIIQKYYIPESNDNYWDAIFEEIDKFCKKYQQVPLARNIGMAFLKTMEEESKKGSKNGEKT